MPTDPPSSAARPRHWRHEVWADLREVARPDARFHFRFADCIPDFEGSARAIDRMWNTPAFAQPRHVFVAPDNSLVGVRQRLLQAGVSVVVPSYNLARGFFHFQAGSVAPEQALFASWLDGMEHFGQAVSLESLAALGRFDWIVTGASAVATSGVRFGRGHGYFDLEWRIFGAIGIVDDHTPIATVVHDVQVLEQALVASADDVPVDWIFTPTRAVQVAPLAAHVRPRRVDWSLVDAQQIQDIPPLAELQRALGLAR